MPHHYSPRDAIDDSLTIVPAPGHTRGHVALWLANTAGRALFSGDVMHHTLQIHALHWNSKFCELPTLRGQRAGS